MDSGFRNVTFGLYCIIYFLMVFSLLLNFFLAIVIDSYSNVKDAVKDCQIESNVLWDIMATIIYPVWACFRKWPQREVLLRELMKADLDRDGKNDEDQENNW